jgi:transketolase
VGSCKAIVTAEEHSVIGGLGAAIGRAVRHLGKPMEHVGIRDQFGCSAHSYDDILDYLGLTTQSILTAIESMHTLSK